MFGVVHKCPLNLPFELASPVGKALKLAWLAHKLNNVRKYNADSRVQSESCTGEEGKGKERRLNVTWNVWCCAPVVRVSREDLLI